MRSDTTLDIAQQQNKHIGPSTLLGRQIALTDKIRSRRTQRGFDLIQLGLVVALIGLLMAGAMVGVPKLVENIKSNQQADDVRTFVAQSQAHFAMFIPDELSLIIANQANLYPSTAIGTPTQVAAVYPSRFGGKVTVGLVANDREMTIKIDGIPSTAVCTKMGAQLAGIATAMNVGAKNVTGSGGRLSMSVLSELCAGSAAVPGADGKQGTDAVPPPKEITITTKI